MTTREQIVDEARSWVDTRWQHQASVKGVATDCIGLIGGVGVRLRIPDALAWASDQRVRAYGRKPDVEALRSAAETYLEPIPVADAGLGDILLMRYEPDPEPRHFAIISALDPMYIVHAFANARKVVENRVDRAWRERIVSAYRYRGVA
jgi:NlpC/P60 family putative phage cell wall peptidase